MENFKGMSGYARRLEEEVKSGAFLPDFLGGLVVIWTLISRIPLPKKWWPASMPSGNRILSAAPLAGAAMGLLSGLAAAGVRSAGFGGVPSAWIGFAFYAAAGWTFHLDGWSDLWDGISSGKSGEEMRSVMKDSRLGSGGAVGLIIAAGLWTSLVSSLQAGEVLPACIIAAASGRFASCAAALSGDYPWQDGMCKGWVDSFENFDLFVAFLCVFVLLPLSPVRWLFSVILAAFVGTAAARAMNSRLGGVNGDVLGAAETAAEIAALLVFAV